MVSQASSPAAASQTLASHRRLFLPDAHYPLLLAIDNDDNAAAAILMTAALTRLGAHPTVVKALQLMAPATGGDAADTTFLFVQSALGEEILQNDKRIIGDIIRNVLGSDPAWPIKVIVGDPSSAILREADEREADLLVLGISRHGAFGQAMGENTATRIMSKAAMPILAVRPDAVSLPRLAMVATDFGNASWEAAHVAANLVNPGGTVVVTHVALPSYPAVDDGDEGQALIQRLGVEGAFQRLATEIKADKSIDVKFVMREGDAGTELLAAAEQIKPDVIATASQRHHLLARMLLGSVSRKLVREGKWSMLVTPPPQPR